MCRECTEFVAALVSPDGASCASVGSVLRIDGVKAAARDTTGMVLNAADSNVLEVRCTVVGRARLVACENLEAWRRPQRDEYLLADVIDVEDEQAAEAVEKQSSAQPDVVDAIYLLVDALLESSDATDAGLDVSSLVSSLEHGAALAEDSDWWAALEVWQMYCATRLAGAAALHRAERNELIIDAKLREGGALVIPVQESTLSLPDRVRLHDLDTRAADAMAQMGLDDKIDFQACLEARQPLERATILHSGVKRESERLARRAALRRAFVQTADRPASTDRRE